MKKKSDRSMNLNYHFKIFTTNDIYCQSQDGGFQIFSSFWAMWLIKNKFGVIDLSIVKIISEFKILDSSRLSDKKTEIPNFFSTFLTFYELKFNTMNSDSNILSNYQNLILVLEISKIKII